MDFKLQAEYAPTGDQPQAIAELVRSLQAGHRHQTLLGVTGSGKTFTLANVVARLNRPALVISHNKTLAAQLYSEFKNFFPENAVEYFVSYYDYYQPEAYLPSSDTYIEKDSSINEEIARQPPRCDRRRQRFVHLRPRFARGLHGVADRTSPRRRLRPQPPAGTPGRQSLRTERLRAQARLFPGARGRGRCDARLFRAGVARGVLG